MSRSRTAFLHCQKDRAGCERTHGCVEPSGFQGQRPGAQWADTGFYQLGQRPQVVSVLNGWLRLGGNHRRLQQPQSKQHGPDLHQGKPGDGLIPLKTIQESYNPPRYSGEASVDDEPVFPGEVLGRVTCSPSAWFISAPKPLSFFPACRSCLKFFHASYYGVAISKFRPFSSFVPTWSRGHSTYSEWTIILRSCVGMISGHNDRKRDADWQLKTKMCLPCAGRIA